MSDLTPRQKQVLDFIKKTITKRWCSPSVREIGAHLGTVSPNAVVGHLKALKRKGYIETDDKATRSIRVVGYRLELVREK